VKPARRAKMTQAEPRAAVPQRKMPPRVLEGLASQQGRLEFANSILENALIELW